MARKHVGIDFSSRGWILASVDGLRSGLVPANRIKITGRKSGTKSEDAKAAPDVVESSFPNNFGDEFK